MADDNKESALRVALERIVDAWDRSPAFSLWLPADVEGPLRREIYAARQVLRETDPLKR